MENTAIVLNCPEQKKDWNRDKLNKNKKGSVYARSGKLYVYFSYKKKRVREPSGLIDTPENKLELRFFLDKIHIEIAEGSFIFADRFPHSTKKEFFSKLEGRKLKVLPSEITFSYYWDKWYKEMQSGMTVNQIRDYDSIVGYYILPYFRDMTFAEFRYINMKKFLSHLKGLKNRYDEPLSGSTINNIFIPLRTITEDAIEEYDFDLSNPFKGLKLPKRKKVKIFPLTREEFELFISNVNPWYVPYFEFAVNTGLRPSEQVALKWSSISDEYIEVELSRVKGHEKKDLKTESSRRSIKINPLIRKLLDDQRKLSAHYNSDYVFVNIRGRVINQDKLRELWVRVEKKVGLKHRRMYELRHTFASWALAAGEQPGWVADILGHVDLSMVYKVYAKFIPSLKKDDGKKMEEFYSKKNKG